MDYVNVKEEKIKPRAIKCMLIGYPNDTEG